MARCRKRAPGWKQVIVHARATSAERPLVVFVGDRAQTANAGTALGGTCELAWVADPAHLCGLKPAVIVLIGETAWKHRPQGRDHVPMVAVVPSRALQHGLGHGAVPPEVLIMGQDDHELPEVVRRLLAPPLLTQRARLALRDLPFLVRRSLELVLEHPAPALVDAVEALALGTAPFAHTRGEFAERFGCSKDHLTRVARRAGLRWADLHRQALYLRLRHHRLLTDDTWAHTFVRFGIGAPSAGTGFVKRVTGGVTPCAADAVRFEEIRDRFFDSIEAGAASTRRVG